jgi:hypothetical protein
MQSIRKLCALSWRQRAILLEAAVLLIVVRLSLWHCGLRHTRRFLRRAEPWFVHLPHVAPLQIAGMVMCAARRCPIGSTCLTRALVARLLFSRSDYESRLCIGVARNPQGEFEAHAWLERNGQIILGGTEEDVDRYRAFDRVDELIA